MFITLYLCRELANEMTLIKSISGIRGTIGGKPGENLTPIDIVKFTGAFGRICLENTSIKKIVIGRDARLSGEMVSGLVTSTLVALGIDVIDLGLSTTPTVELSVVEHKAGGGIIITASHNPVQWNALKLLNDKGEFISNDEGMKVLEYAEKNDIEYSKVLKLGKIINMADAIDKHIEAVLAHPMVNVDLIRSRGFRIAVDAVNSTGGIAIPKLLKALGVDDIKQINCEPTGHFAHNPEPVPENLTAIISELEKGKYDLGIVVDPDVDRLALICEDGTPFGEEYTLVAVADYYLSKNKGTTVSNLSSSRALRDITEKHGQQYYASAVGEVNVVNAMKQHHAVIGGEGNGGVIVPDFHYGRDALIGIGLFLTHLAGKNIKCSRLRSEYPNYHLRKNKMELPANVELDEVLGKIAQQYSSYEVNLTDGVKIEFDREWVHLRKSNTEPIIRIYSESANETTADNLANKLLGDIREIISKHEE